MQMREIIGAGPAKAFWVNRRVENETAGVIPRPNVAGTGLLDEQASDNRSIEQLMWSFNDWLSGGAMNNVNDDGERYSLKPYLDTISTLSKMVPPKRLRALQGTIYRGVQTDAVLESPTPGPVKTANKRFQSWSPDLQVARTFAKDYQGKNGYVFYADVQTNRRLLVLSAADVYDWYKTQEKPNRDILYMMESFAEQNEILLRGTTVQITKIEQVRGRR